MGNQQSQQSSGSGTRVSKKEWKQQQVDNCRGDSKKSATSSYGSGMISKAMTASTNAEERRSLSSNIINDDNAGGPTQTQIPAPTTGALTLNCKSPLENETVGKGLLSVKDEEDQTGAGLLTFDQKIKLNNRHHYNIHDPGEILKHLEKRRSILDLETDPCKTDPSSPERKETAVLDCISNSRSPLTSFIKAAFGKVSCPEDSNKNLGIGPGPGGRVRTSGRGTEGQNPNQNMNCNLSKYAKLLAQLSGHQKQGLINEPTFQKHFIPHSKTASKYLWRYFTNRIALASSLTEISFVGWAEKMYALITDKDQITFYLKVFGNGKDSVDRDAFLDFLISAYLLSVISLGQVCAGEEELIEDEWIESVVKACYHIKDEMSVCFLQNWLTTNLPRLVMPLHKYILHQLSTGYTQLTTGNKTINTSSSGITAAPDGFINRLSSELKAIESSETDSSSRESSRLNPVMLWLLRCSLPKKFISVFDRKLEQPSAQVLSPTQLILHMLHHKPEPEKWSLLYDSELDGLSINRFQFHVFNYRGPSLMIIKADNGYTLAIASDSEWKESCHFWGGDDTVILQLQPEFRIVERGPKLLYMNFSIRGYPFGIQAGKDPRNVSLDIKPDFAYAYFKKIPCPILKFSVWGCAPQQAKVSQVEFKNWEAKQCEKIRKVNINSAEWKENPDKYLLELAGAYKSYDN